MKKWKVAVVGCGSFANSQYLPNIQKVANAECVAVCDIVPEQAQKAAARFNVPNIYYSVHDLVKECEFDIAVDAASIPAHHEINMAVLESGRHLISQKPAALTPEKMDLQIQAAKKAGVKFACVPIHMIRPDILMAKQMIRDGAIGEIYSVKCVSTHGGPEYFQYRSADPSWFYEPGAGALYDMGVHALHQVTGIMGPAKRISCLASTSMKERVIRSGRFDGKVIKTDKIPDNYFISLDFGNDKIGFVDTGFGQKATRSVPLEIFGTKGTISFDSPGSSWPNPKAYIDSPELGVRGWIEPMTWVKNQRLPNFGHCSCLTDLVTAIENNAEPVLSPEHAKHVIEIMCMIPVSVEEGRFVDLKTSF